jgi:hypothetical protein
MIITVAMGCRSPQAQAAFTEHPRLYLRLLRAVSRMGSSPSPEGTSVVTGHDPWIDCAQTSRTRFVWTSHVALVSSRHHTLGVRYWPAVVLSAPTFRGGLARRTLLLRALLVKSRLGNDCLCRSEPALLHICDVSM